VPAVFLDSSALVKLVRPEAETQALRGYLAQPRRPMLISELAVTEVTRAARRICVDPVSALAECEIVLLRSEHLERAGQLEPPTLRALDAIQLATALALGGHFETFIVYDERLAAAAAACGLDVASPV
jgi:predicted nucleic acid-binding protein